MRISDWSSDVCSSDLKRNAAVAAPQQSLYLLRPIWHRVVRLVSLGNMHLPPTSTEAKHRPELGSLKAHFWPQFPDRSIGQCDYLNFPAIYICHKAWALGLEIRASDESQFAPVRRPSH